MAYENGGAGHDTTNDLSKAGAKPAPQEPTKRLSLDLPQSLHTRFKTACSATGRKMVGEMQTYIEARTEELEAEAGISRK